MRSVALRREWLYVLCACLMVEGAVCLAASCGPPKQAAPQRRTGGESFPPLPLPATPIRRTEKKRPPAPPALIGKIQYGQIVWAEDGGKRYSFRDWTTDPDDINRLISLTNSALQIQYRAMETTFEEFSYNPAEIPILYLTGHEAFSLSPEKRQQLRLFLNDGGYLIGDACCGAEAYFKSFVAEMQQIFPDKPLRLLPPDHPLFQTPNKIEQVEIKEEGKAMGPKLPLVFGIDFGCRTAIFVSPYDLSCGWDGHDHDTGKRIAVNDARRIGVNIMAYCLANYQLGRFLATQRVYHQEGQASRDEFVFAQVVHGGDWDPCPNGVMNFLRYARGNSTLPVQFKRVGVKLSDPDVLRYPVLFITGHHDFVLSEADAAGLTNYLRSGGILFGCACCGRAAFDTAFRREIARVLPNDAALQIVPPDHPLLSAHNAIRAVSYSPMIKAQFADLSAPVLEGVSINGQLAVIYSRFGISSEWDGQERPYSLCYAPEDGLRVGLNVLIYAMTH